MLDKKMIILLPFQIQDEIEVLVSISDDFNKVEILNLSEYLLL